MTRRFIIDTDTASDDAVALIMALQWPDVTVDAITIVAGNVPMKQCSINARYVVELCGQEVPVYEGCAKPMLRDYHDAKFFHGPDGLGGMNYPAPKATPAGHDAVSELIRRFKEAPGEITLVTLGPITNVATALVIEPRLAEWVKECYVMGGAACTVGNITPAAEYNVWCDPEAAQILFNSGMKIMMVGWEHCRGEANLDDAEMQKVLDFGTERAQFSIDCNRNGLEASREWLSDPGMGLPDPVTMAIALNPAVCTKSSMHNVQVCCDSDLCRGMTVVDELRVTENETNELKAPATKPNIEVCWTIDFDLWKETLYQTLR